ncbi:nucleoside-diphosphate kinase [Actinokineospora cianjurensis]|uniref:Nucleoside diphosphate kinase n=1 Tax=Actinokineospora cianjurensis TaxID=585224 RepID=A0A421AZ33_9PSEU|nr:nucleoside-diphosphate kinase [Actinokineospora cianjurensis]RLK55049.1 nucleoside diphosphate kinase [Actinokineospora cianjurensis]
MVWELDPAERLDGVPSEDEWAWLTVVPGKPQVFGRDLHFREGWADFVDAFGEGVVGAVSGLALLTVKPDAVVGRRLRRTVDYLAGNGFVPVGAVRFGYTRHSAREVWRYDWDVYPVDRLRFSSLWYAANDVMLVVARDVRPTPGVPAAVRLGALKGVTDPALNQWHHLRTVLRPPNRVLNFVHVADEPADVVRELAIFLDRPELTRLLGTIRESADRTEQVHATIAELEADYPAHDLDVEAALDRMAPAIGAEAQGRLSELIASNSKIRWDEFTALVPQNAVDLWDVIVVASFVVPRERPV